MLPSDHPDFFRRPAPEGRSRESTIVLDAEGRFWHEGQPVQHPGMQLAFATWIGRHPDDGRYILCNGYDWSYFRVNDVPFFVRGVRAVEANLLIALSDGSEEALDPGTLRVGARDALYCNVKSGAFEARFMPSTQAALVAYAALTPSGEPGLTIGGVVHPMAKLLESGTSPFA
jgi:uncharacterized protein